MNTYPALAKKAQDLGFRIKLDGDWIELEPPANDPEGPHGDFMNKPAGLAFLYDTLRKYEQLQDALKVARQH